MKSELDTLQKQRLELIDNTPEVHSTSKKQPTNVQKTTNSRIENNQQSDKKQPTEMGSLEEGQAKVEKATTNSQPTDVQKTTDSRTKENFKKTTTIDIKNIDIENNNIVD